MRGPIAAMLVAAWGAGCSLAVDTSGLTGGPAIGDDGAIADLGVDSTVNDSASDATDARVDSTTDSPGSDARWTDGDAGPDVGPDVGPDGGIDARADAPLACPTGMVKVTAPSGKPDYCMDSTEVTARAYQTWLGGSPSIGAQPAECAWNTTYAPNVTSGYPSGWWPPDATHASYPIRWVNWCDAYMYCKDNDKDLCGAYGGGRINPGDYGDPAKSQWMNACSKDGAQTYCFGNTDDGRTCAEKPTFSYPVAGGSLAGCVGGYPGLYDLSGNLEEWEDNCVTPLTGAGAADDCHTRGGSYGATDISCANPQIYARDTQLMWVGFRCCKN